MRKSTAVAAILLSVQAQFRQEISPGEKSLEDALDKLDAAGTH